MSDVKLPLSGDVTQAINPFTALFSPFSNISVNVGSSSDPSIEKDAISQASYGKQLGRIEDALVVLLNTYQPKRRLTEREAQAIDDLGRMLHDINDVKHRRGLETLELMPAPEPAARTRRAEPASAAT